ncbi:hypothetical protein K525DRAFT_274810 [Schizophyllum commune Loenen D]|nr:hypothetical protein K525DRAFT_274810 [Schizophyllum commune Loenen D]
MAQPVSRDDFFYDGTMFYVELEGKHRHPRCDVSSLHGLLTYTPGPLLTKKGQVAKRQPPPYKDPPAHFYTAQMIHYGLKPLKTRDPAKKKLLAACGGSSTIAVPAHILQLKQQLATESGVNNKSPAKQSMTNGVDSAMNWPEKLREVSVTGDTFLPFAAPGLERRRWLGSPGGARGGGAVGLGQNAVEIQMFR